METAQSIEPRLDRGESFANALGQCRPRLLRVALLLVGSRADAEDLTQRALLRGWESRHRFRGGSELYTWLYRILVNGWKDLWKSRGRAEGWLAEHGRAVAIVQETSPGIEDDLRQREQDELVRRSLGRLDAASREILVLRHYEELSYEQLAATLACPVGTVRSRLSTARSRLRAELAAAGVEGRESHDGLR